jgi:integrase
VATCRGRSRSGNIALCHSCHDRFLRDSKGDSSITVENWIPRQRTLFQPGWIDLTDLPDQFANEVRFVIYCLATEPNAARWPTSLLRRAINNIAEHIQASITELAHVESEAIVGYDGKRFVNVALPYLRPVLTSREESREMGFFDTAHWGVSLPGGSIFDLTGISQPWLREVTWDWMAARMDSPKRRPRSSSTFSMARVGITIMSDFLAEHRADKGLDPLGLTRADAQAYDSDWSRRVTRREKTRVTGNPATPSNCYANTLKARQVLKETLESPEGIEIAREFVYALQVRDNPSRSAPRPFPDEVYAALVDPDNLLLLAQLDSQDMGIADVWLTQAAQGRRINEVLTLGLDSIGIIGGQPRLWHDMSKVGVTDHSIPLADFAYQALLRRQEKTLARFERRHHRPPTADERSAMAMFPSLRSNPWFTRSVAAATFRQTFREWLNLLDLKGYTSHQARHTLATELLNNGATPQMVRQFLGQVSETALNAYARYSDAKLNPYLAKVWVRGPGADNPGEVVLTPGDFDADGDTLAHRRMIELTVIPTEGGLCTFKPVVGGDACPKGRRCDVCEDLVLTGADYTYWKRQEAKFMDWAESSASDQAREAFYKVWQPMGTALFGLEKALDALGLLQAAQDIDLRSPAHDFHNPLWKRGWAVTDLHEIAETPDDAQEAM